MQFADLITYFISIINYDCRIVLTYPLDNEIRTFDLGLIRLPLYQLDMVIAPLNLADVCLEKIRY